MNCRCHLRSESLIKMAEKEKMESSSSETEFRPPPISIPSSNPRIFSAERSSKLRSVDEWEWPQKGRSGGAVMLEGYIEMADGGENGSDGGGDVVGRTKSLTDEDLEELKGCLDLGFGFCYDEIPELCNTLPALELCYSMSQKFLDEQQQRHSVDGETVDGCGATAAASAPIANWKISSPGDNPDDVKARLKYWAQAVACTVKLCN